MTEPLLKLRPASTCRYDGVALGEVMLRLDPGEGRIRSARSFRVWEGGGEYNVARGLRKTFGLRTAVVTALPRNEAGALAEDLILEGGVDTTHILWREADGIGRNTRMGLNFTERGFGVRPALGCSDRANSAAAQMRPDEVDWDRLFGEDGVRWLHTGGVFTAPLRRDLDILDRVGGGDGFVAGMAWALLNDLGPQAAVDYGAAHGALAMTTPGDNAMTSLAEVQALVAGGTGAARR